jgi:hypothetical protein
MTKTLLFGGRRVFGCLNVVKNLFTSDPVDDMIKKYEGEIWE